MAAVTRPEIEIDEGERLPNKFALRALVGIFAMLMVACLLNDIHVFEVDRIAMWASAGMAIFFCVIAFVLVKTPKLLAAPFTKYILMSMVLMLSLAVNVFFNISVVLLILLPMLIATRYRSVNISIMAIAGSAVCAVIAPLIAWGVHAWSLNIMIGYVETTCNVKIVGLHENLLPRKQAITNILLYMSLPQLMIIFIFGGITMSITYNSIAGVKNRVKVNQLSENLEQELDKVSRLSNNLVDVQEHILFSMADIIESRDNNTGGHVKRTSKVVSLIVNDMRKDPNSHVTDEFCDAVIKAAPLHDIGKISVDDAILRKPDALTGEERLQIQNHTTIGAELINNVLRGVENEEFVQIAYNIALYHHEAFDGSGYPEHLKGTTIPLEARIMAVADVYDALVSKRHYKEAMPSEVAFQKIEEMFGTNFDPALKPHFLAVRNQIDKFYLKENE